MAGLIPTIDEYQADQIETVGYIFNMLGSAESKTDARARGSTPPELLEHWGVHKKLQHCKRMNAVTDEEAERLCVLKRLALAKATHPRLGAASVIAADLHELEQLQTIACESGLRWRDEKETRSCIICCLRFKCLFRCMIC